MRCLLPFVFMYLAMVAGHTYKPASWPRGLALRLAALPTELQHDPDCCAGTLSDITFVQRINSLGGNVPGGASAGRRAPAKLQGFVSPITTRMHVMLTSWLAQLHDP